MARTLLRVIVAGSRTVKDYLYVRDRLLTFVRDHPDCEIVWVSGMAAEGPDDMAYHFARWDMPGQWVEMAADWDSYGKSAGYIRNAEMAKLADELLLFWDGRSNGSRHMRETMNKQGKPVTTHVLDVTTSEGDFEIFDFRTIAL